MNTFTRHISIQSTYSKSYHEFIQHKSIQTWLLSIYPFNHLVASNITYLCNSINSYAPKWNDQQEIYLGWLMIIQLASFNSYLCKPSNISNKSSATCTWHLYVDSSWTSLSCHGIGIMIIAFQYLAQSHDQHNEYHLNQASNAHGTYTHLSTFWWYPNKVGSSQVRSNILRHNLSMNSGMFCNSNHRGIIIILVTWDNVV